MNITLSVDERIAEAAREAARTMGKSLNPGRLQGWRFDREAVHDRR
jgi:hypothetical protein